MYAIQDQANTKPFGRIVFTPEEGGHPWRFSWSYNGIPQPVSDSDTVELEVALLGDGVYAFQAERDGVVSRSAPVFHVFFDYVPEFSIHLTDLFNCKAVSIAEITDFQIPVYRYGNYQPFEEINHMFIIWFLISLFPGSFRIMNMLLSPKRKLLRWMSMI